MSAEVPDIIMPGQAHGRPPWRIVLNAVEGWGKTTAGAHADAPLVVMACGETGYDTLLSSGLVPDVPRVRISSFDQALALCDSLLANPRGIKTAVLDALSGFERMCHEHVCQRDFRNSEGVPVWGEQGFTAYQRGYEIAVPEWIKLLVRLDALRDKHGINVLMLSHAKVKMYQNPVGPNFDSYVADCHEKTWGQTAKWADAVLFGAFHTLVRTASGQQDKPGAKGKAYGGAERRLYTERRDTWDAKNRYGMEPEIAIPDDPTQAWATIHAAMSGGNSNGSV